LTGTGSAGITLTVPDIEKNYIINNGLSVDVGVKNSSGSQVTVPDGKSALVYSTGSGVVDAITSLNTAEITQLNVVARNEVRFEDSAGGQYVGFRAPADVGSSVTFSWPSADGTNGQGLITDGSGNLSFGAAGVTTGKAIAMAIVFG
jgi:hypothetical protein